MSTGLDTDTEIRIGIDGLANLATSVAMGLGIDPIITGSFIGTDVLYQLVLQDYFEKSFGQTVADHKSRSIVLRSVLTAVVMWVAARVGGTDIGTVEAIVNSATSYIASMGLQELVL